MDSGEEEGDRQGHLAPRQPRRRAARNRNVENPNRPATVNWKSVEEDEFVELFIYWE